MSLDDLHEIWQFKAARTSMIEVFGDGKYMAACCGIDAHTEMETEGDDGAVNGGLWIMR